MALLDPLIKPPDELEADPHGQASDVGTVQPPPATRTTTSNQDWAKGDLNITDDQVYFTPPAGSSRNDTVEGRLTGILAGNSPYITSARESAKQVANSRGLINSTMAATAGEKAAIDSALPIAQQDAGYFQSRNLNDQQGDISSRLQKEQGDIQTGLYETQGDITSRLSDQGYTQDMALKQADIDWQKIDLRARMDVEYDRMDADIKSRFDETTDKIASEYQQNYMAILADPKFNNDTDRQKAINVLNKSTRDRYNIAAAIAGVDLYWSPDGTRISKQ